MVSKGCCGFDNNIMRAERYGTNIIYNSRVFTRCIINNRAYKNKKSRTYTSHHGYSSLPGRQNSDEY